MKVVIRILAACCVLFSATAQAALTVYMDRATFNASNPGLVIEDFEEGIPKIGFPSPLNSTSDNGAFDPGDILDGVEFVSTELNPDALTIADGNDLTGLATKTLVKNASTSDELSFLQIKLSGNNVYAVGLDIYLTLGTGGGLVADNTEIRLFGSGGGLLDTQTITTLTSGPIFFGVSSDSAAISRVEVDGFVEGFFSFEGIDDVAFNPRSIPEPTTVLLMTLGLAGIGFAQKRKGPEKQE